MQQKEENISIQSIIAH